MEDFTNIDDLISYLRGRGILKSFELEKALRQVRRKDFIGANQHHRAYQDHPLSIGFEQTISQPSTVVFMLESLKIKPGEKILDIGSGCGWQTGLIAHMAGHEGKVIGIEIIPELVKKSRQLLRAYHFTNAQIIEGDGNEGFSLEAPYDKIIIAAATKYVPPKLWQQLRVGGKMILPVGEGTQRLVLLTKDINGKFSKEVFPGFLFVPFINQ